MSTPTHYEILDVPKDATTEAVKQAYRRKVRVTHPDQGGSAALFQMVQQAWDVLGDPGKRALYDHDLRTGTTTPPPQPEPEPAPAPSPPPRRPRTTFSDQYRQEQPTSSDTADADTADADLPGRRASSPAARPPQSKGPSVLEDLGPAAAVGIWAVFAGALSSRSKAALFAALTAWSVAVSVAHVNVDAAVNAPPRIAIWPGGNPFLFALLYPLLLLPLAVVALLWARELVGRGPVGHVVAAAVFTLVWWVLGPGPGIGHLDALLFSPVVVGVLWVAVKVIAWRARRRAAQPSGSTAVTLRTRLSNRDLRFR